MLRFEYEYFYPYDKDGEPLAAAALVKHMNKLGAQGFQWTRKAVDRALIFERIVDADGEQRAAEHGETRTEPPRMVDHTCGCGCREEIRLSEADSKRCVADGLVPYAAGHGPHGEQSPGAVYLSEPAPKEWKRK